TGPGPHIRLYWSTMTNATATIAQTGPRTSIDKHKIRILLLEGIHPSAEAVLRAAGYSQIESLPGALPDDQLKAKLADAHFVGIRSRTQLTAEVLSHATR